MSNDFKKRAMNRFASDSPSYSLADHILSPNPHPGVIGEGGNYSFDSNYFYKQESEKIITVTLSQSFITRLNKTESNSITAITKVSNLEDSLAIVAENENSHYLEVSGNITAIDTRVIRIDSDVTNIKSSVDFITNDYVSKSNRFFPETYTEIESSETLVNIDPGMTLYFVPSNAEVSFQFVVRDEDKEEVRKQYGTTHLFMMISDTLVVNWGEGLILIDDLVPGKMNHIQIEYFGLTGRVHVVDSW